MFWVRWLVTASSSAEAQAARPIQSKRSDHCGAAAAGDAAAARRACSAMRHRATATRPQRRRARKRR